MKSKSYEYNLNDKTTQSKGYNKDRKNDREHNVNARNTTMKWYSETVYCEKYEVRTTGITNTEYNFRRYRDNSLFESDSFCSEESSECYCNIRAVRIA